MISVTDKTRHFQHIIWQPTFSCNTVCNGCYVSRGALGCRETAFSPELFRMLFTIRCISTDQLTLSLDNTLKPDVELCKTIRLIWDLYNEENSYPYELPDLCVTVRSWNSLLIWCRALSLSVKDFLTPLSILSLSTFPTLGKTCEDVLELCRTAGTTLNYNCLVQEKTSESRSFIMGTRYADMTYLVLQKGVLGEETSEEAAKWYFQVRDKLVEEMPDKLFTDSCMMARVEQKLSETTCSAGIGIACVWPGNVVTGCPYDSNGEAACRKPTLRESLRLVTNPMEKYCEV